MKNKIKNSKIIIFAVIVCLVFSLTAVSAFAIDDTYTGEYTFLSELSPASLISSTTYDFKINFSVIDGDGNVSGSYSNMSVEIYNDGNVYTIMYDDVTVFQYGAWVSDEYRYIYINELFTDEANANLCLGFLDVNGTAHNTALSIYTRLEQIITNVIFGDNELTNEQALSVSLLCTTLSLGVIVVPFLIVGACFIWVLKRL